MISFDTNILFASLDSANTSHARARAFLSDYLHSVEVCLCEQVLDVNPAVPFMDEVWSLSSSHSFAYRRIFDLRLAKTLQQHGVTDFATCNIKDFQTAGFHRLWNPLAPADDT